MLQLLWCSSGAQFTCLREVLRHRIALQFMMPLLLSASRQAVLQVLQVAEDKTFGLKNKKSSAKVQK